ncbi:hypothetical protein ACLOJK_004841, partial [Asimina triloba]
MRLIGQGEDKHEATRAASEVWAPAYRKSCSARVHESQAVGLMPWSERAGKKKGASATQHRMGYVLRVRLASFFAGAATASAFGFYVLQRDYKIAHNAISQR